MLHIERREAGDSTVKAEPTLGVLLVKSANEALRKQNSNEAMPAGQNGPYGDAETPVRNTAHWLFSFCRLYKRTQNKVFYEAAQKAADYLLSSEARPMGASFWCRKNPEKDFCNGVMGQAWVIEALVEAARVLKRQECYRLAEEVFLLHPWDGMRCLW